ncbi:gliding motility-associated lipoprotein GldD [Dysgonomonas hofstadii]|uniref:Gliding motility-associated lipoprotein GldD n=1 Tax=Dysgonomonas hofstadii TaxID=637886 RepID=A0A840CY95_9BACT|nr:hypothetical protein [Dysgonomonas hofstadii]MBB4037725.1 gliding motility-associated lipoprotein GldD [Dysgonomonas hofstadii]
MKNRGLLYLIFPFLFLSCAEYTPRPAGFQRFDRAHYDYLKFENPALSFLYPADAKIEEVKNEANPGYWFNILYPQYNATLYCTYIPIKKEDLSKALDDSYQLAYSHTSRAEGIFQSQYTDSLNHKEGVIYDIKGLVAVPVQFYITDNTSNFLRGSLYFDQNVKIDSVAPIVEYIRSDIVYLMESLKWKN